MKIEKNKQKALEIVVYVLFAVFSFWLAAQIPYTDDDWDWGLPVGIEQLVTASLNSRYAGNFLVVVLTRSVFLKTLVMGATYFLIPFTVTHIVTGKRRDSDCRTRIMMFLACNFLILSMDRNVLRQTYFWVSGFSNYVMSALLAAVYLYEARDVLEGTWDRKQDSVLRCVLVFVLSVIMQLFLENLALYMVLLSVFVCFASCKQWRKLRRKYAAMLLGNLVGLAIMFSNSLYSSLFRTGRAVGGYRELTVSTGLGLMGSIYTCIRQLVIHLIPKTRGYNTVITIAILACITWLLVKDRAGKKHVRFFLVINAALTIFFLIDSFSVFDRILGTIPAIYVRGMVNCVYFASTTIQLVMIYRERKQYLRKVMLLWLSAPAVILPLAAVTEAGFRLFITSNLFLILLVLFLLADIWTGLNEKGIRISSALTALAAAGTVLFYGWIFFAIGSCNSENNQILTEARETQAKTVCLTAYPYEDYLWYPASDISGEYRWAYFREFYGLAEDVTITIDRSEP